MQPLAGVVVSHDGYDEPTAITDEHGYFELSSVSNIEFAVLMAGHALQVYPVKFTTSTTTAYVYLLGSMKMIHEEVVSFSTPVVIDPSPQEIALPPAGKFPSHQQLSDSLADDQLFGHCDQSTGFRSLFLLNTARKIYHLQKQNVESEQLQQLTELHYENAREYWEYFYESCTEDATEPITIDINGTRMDLYELIQEETASRFEISDELRYQFMLLGYGEM